MAARFVKSDIGDISGNRHDRSKGRRRPRARQPKCKQEHGKSRLHYVHFSSEPAAANRLLKRFPLAAHTRGIHARLTLAAYTYNTHPAGTASWDFSTTGTNDWVFRAFPEVTGT